MKVSSAAANVSTATKSVSKTSLKQSSDSTARSTEFKEVVDTVATDQSTSKLIEKVTKGQKIPEVTIDSQSQGGGDNSYITVQATSTVGDDGSSNGDDGDDNDGDNEKRPQSVIDQLA